MMPMDNPIKVRVKMPNFKPGVREWQERLVEELKKEEECVRRDAKVEVKDVKEDGNDASLFVLKVVLEQRIVNTPEEYSVKYSKIVNRYLHNLTISTSYMIQTTTRPPSVGRLPSKPQLWISGSTTKYRFLS